MKIIIKFIFLGLFSTAFPTIAFAEQPTALYQINQNNKNLIDDWKNYKLIDKEALAKVDHEYKKFDESLSSTTTDEQGLQLLIDLSQKIKFESLEIMQKFQPKTPEMQDLLQIKISLIDLSMNHLINRLKNPTITNDETYNQEIEAIKNLAAKGKTLQDEIEKKVTKSSQ